MNQVIDSALRRLKEWQQQAELEIRRTADETYEQVTPIVDRAEAETREGVKKLFRRRF